MLIHDVPGQIADNLWMLGSEEYPLYLFRDGGAAALFEGGTGAVGPLVCRQLEQLGVPRESVAQIVLPHAHPDHVMAVPLFREVFPHVKVLASEPAAKILAMEKAIAQFCQIDDAITEAMLKQGLVGPQQRRVPPAENRIAVDRTLREGDTVTVGNVAFDVLHTPGHSECSLSFYQPHRKILLVSDAASYYAHRHDYWWPNYFTGYPAYLSSIERLAGLKAEILCLGHHGAIRGADDVQAYLANALAAARHYHGRIIEQLRSGVSVRQLAERLGAEVHQTMQTLPLDFFQKNCGVLVKQSARHEGVPV